MTGSFQAPPVLKRIFNRGRTQVINMRGAKGYLHQRAKVDQKGQGGGGKWKGRTRDQGTWLMIWEEKRGSPGAGFVMLKCFSPLVFPLFFSFCGHHKRIDYEGLICWASAQEHTCGSGGEVTHAAHAGLDPLQRLLVILNHFLTSTFFSQWRNLFIFVTSCSHQ